MEVNASAYMKEASRRRKTVMNRKEQAACLIHEFLWVLTGIVLAVLLSSCAPRCAQGPFVEQLRKLPWGRDIGVPAEATVRIGECDYLQAKIMPKRDSFSCIRTSYYLVCDGRLLGLFAFVSPLDVRACVDELEEEFLGRSREFWQTDKQGRIILNSVCWNVPLAGATYLRVHISPDVDRLYVPSLQSLRERVDNDRSWIVWIRPTNSSTSLPSRHTTAY